MSRINILTAVGGILAATVLTAGGASAQGYGHRHVHQGYAPKTHVCYEKISTPDVYGTVQKAVIKEAGRWEVQEIAAVYAEREIKVLVKPEWHEPKVEAAVYEERERKVLVAPEKKIVHVTSAVYKTEYVSHKVSDGYGRQTYATSGQQKLVEPAKKEVAVTPAVYKSETYKVLVKPERHYKVAHAAVYETKVEKYIAKPAYQHKVYHKPVIEYVEEKVIVKHGHSFTRPVHKAHGEAC